MSTVDKQQTAVTATSTTDTTNTHSYMLMIGHNMYSQQPLPQQIIISSTYIIMTTIDVAISSSNKDIYLVDTVQL